MLGMLGMLGMPDERWLFVCVGAARAEAVVAVGCRRRDCELRTELRRTELRTAARPFRQNKGPSGRGASAAPCACRRAARRLAVRARGTGLDGAADAEMTSHYLYLT